MSLLLLFKSSVPAGAGGSSGSPAPLPSLSSLFSLTYTLTAEQGTYTLDGRDANFPRIYLLDAAQGTYTLAGQDAVLRTLPVLSAEQGTYSLSGQSANLNVGYSLLSNVGFYDLTGQAATLQEGNLEVDSPAPLPHLGLLGGLGNIPVIITAESGTYSVSGQSVNFVTTYILRANQGTYTQSGQIASLSKSGASSENPAPLPHLGLVLGIASGSTVLNADPGIYSIVGSEGLVDLEMGAETSTYSLTGFDAGLNYQYYLVAQQGTYGIVGQDITFTVSGNVTMAAEQGTYLVSGQVTNVLRGYPISALQGFYSLAGQAAEVYTGTSGTTGTLNRTNLNDSLSANGTSTISGNLSRTNNNDVLVATGINDNTIFGVVTVVNLNDTLTSSGQSTSSGTLSTTNSNDTSTGFGTTTVIGTLNKTNANDTSSGYGYPGNPATITTKLLLTGAGQT